MATWTAQRRVAGDPDDVLAVLTEPDVIARWSPIEFELVDARVRRLRSGERVRVRGYLAGRCLEFAVDVEHAEHGCLRLRASGPVDLDVEYVATSLSDGSAVYASVGVSGRGILGRVLSQATDALLAAGALKAAVARIADELDRGQDTRRVPRDRVAPALAA